VRENIEYLTMTYQPHPIKEFLKMIYYNILIHRAYTQVSVGPELTD
jgi:hypothetical protein